MGAQRQGLTGDARLPHPELVVVIAGADDLHAHAVTDAVRRRGVPARWVDTAAFGAGQTIELSSDSSLAPRLTLADGDVVELSESTTVWWRRPQVPPPADATDPDIAGFVQSEWEHVLAAIEPLSRCRWVNSPAAERAARTKAVQLVRAVECGLTIPATLITNDARAVERFAADHPAIVYKRVGDGPGPAIATRLLDDEARQRLAALQRCPATFQELIGAAADIRVNVVGSTVIAVEIASQEGTSPLDWRFDHAVPFREIDLPDMLERCLLQLLARLGLVTAAIDLRTTETGDYVFLEANPAGQFLFADLLAGVATYEVLADELTGSPRASTSVRARSTLVPA